LNTKVAQIGSNLYVIIWLDRNSNDLITVPRLARHNFT